MGHPLWNSLFFCPAVCACWACPSRALASVKGGREAGKKREKGGKKKKKEGKKDLT